MFAARADCWTAYATFFGAWYNMWMNVDSGIQGSEVVFLYVNSLLFGIDCVEAAQRGWPHLVLRIKNRRWYTGTRSFEHIITTQKLELPGRRILDMAESVT